MPPTNKRMRSVKVPVVSLVDCKRQRSTLMISSPTTAKLFNNSYLSDVILKVGASSFFAHRLVLSAASDVFAKMFEPDWSDGQKPEVVLVETPECERIFDRFLKYLYCGKILIQRELLFPLFMLVDKYNVETLYNECAANLEKGLAVRLEVKRTPVSDCDTTVPPPTSPSPRPSSSLASTDCDELARPTERIDYNLVPNVTFPLTTVMRMLNVINNDNIYNAALYNLESRLAEHIQEENYKVWVLLEPELLIRLLADDHFYCKEFIIFKAIKSWLQTNEDHVEQDTVREILSKIRFGVMSPEELYDVESDRCLIPYPETTVYVKEAIRYKLFKDCPRAMEKENWSGVQFKKRCFKTL